MKIIEGNLNINGLDIYVKRIGNGEPLVFLHGGPGIEHRAFLPFVSPLSETFTLYFYDQPGCGLSQKAANYTFKQEIDILEELRRSIGIDKLNIVGESWGTILALLYATTYPENVQKLLLSSAIGASQNGFIRFGNELNSRLTEEDKQKLSDVEQKLSQGEASVQDIFSILDAYYVYDRNNLVRREPLSVNPEVNAALGKEIEDSYNVINKLPLLSNIPILVVQGDSDIISPLLIQELLLQYLPHATLKVIEQCGHWVFVEQTEQFNEIVRSFFA